MERGNPQFPATAEFFVAECQFRSNGRDPATHVIQRDAQAYCDWLVCTERLQYRLSTEANREASCHAGMVVRFQHSDEAAVRCCLEKFSVPQRSVIKTLRSDMGPATLSAQMKLPNAQIVIDRFDAAQKLGASADAREKTSAAKSRA